MVMNVLRMVSRIRYNRQNSQEVHPLILGFLEKGVLRR